MERKRRRRRAGVSAKFSPSFYTWIRCIEGVCGIVIELSPLLMSRIRLEKRKTQS